MTRPRESLGYKGSSSHGPRLPWIGVSSSPSASQAQLRGHHTDLCAPQSLTPQSPHRRHLCLPALGSCLRAGGSATALLVLSCPLLPRGDHKTLRVPPLFWASRPTVHTELGPSLRGFPQDAPTRSWPLSLSWEGGSGLVSPPLATQKRRSCSSAGTGSPAPLPLLFPRNPGPRPVGPFPSPTPSVLLSQVWLNLSVSPQVGLRSLTGHTAGTH